MVNYELEVNEKLTLPEMPSLVFTIQKREEHWKKIISILFAFFLIFLAFSSFSEPVQFKIKENLFEGFAFLIGTAAIAVAIWVYLPLQLIKTALNSLEERLPSVVLDSNLYQILTVDELSPQERLFYNVYLAFDATRYDGYKKPEKVNEALTHLEWAKNSLRNVIHQYDSIEVENKEKKNLSEFLKILKDELIPELKSDFGSGKKINKVLNCLGEILPTLATFDYSKLKIEKHIIPVQKNIPSSTSDFLFKSVQKFFTADAGKIVFDLLFCLLVTAILNYINGAFKIFPWLNEGIILTGLIALYIFRNKPATA